MKNPTALNYKANLGTKFTKARFKAFAERNFARMRQQYPFLPKQQVRCKVKTLWEKLHVKKRTENQHQNIGRVLKKRADELENVLQTEHENIESTDIPGDDDEKVDLPQSNEHVLPIIPEGCKPSNNEQICQDVDLEAEIDSPKKENLLWDLFSQSPTETQTNISNADDGDVLPSTDVLNFSMLYKESEKIFL